MWTSVGKCDTWILGLGIYLGPEDNRLCRMPFGYGNDGCGQSSESTIHCLKDFDYDFS
jgi:hypothetical protein